MSLTIDLSDRHILVTGASRGIGAAIARILAKAGARVGVHYGTSAEAARTLAAEIGGVPLQSDLAAPDGAARLWETAIDELERIDALVNNAGVAISASLDSEGADWDAAWDRTLTVNLRAAAQLTRRAVQHFRSHGDGGRIVNVASRAAFRGDTPDYLAYAASKAGLVAITRSIARGLGKEGIVAFTVAPGFTRTEMAEPFIEAYGEDYATKDIALPRLTEPDDIAPTVAFLLSGMADHATGSTIDLNAGSYIR